MHGRPLDLDVRHANGIVRGARIYSNVVSPPVVSALLGFSIAIGGFLAGVTLANLPYNLEIIARVKPLRDFFSPLFFVALGMEIPFGSLGRVMVPFIVFLLFLILLKLFLIHFDSKHPSETFTNL